MSRREAWAAEQCGLWEFGHRTITVVGFVSRLPSCGGSCWLMVLAINLNDLEFRLATLKVVGPVLIHSSLVGEWFKSSTTSSSAGMSSSCKTVKT